MICEQFKLLGGAFVVLWLGLAPVHAQDCDIQGSGWNITSGPVCDVEGGVRFEAVIEVPDPNLGSFVSRTVAVVEPEQLKPDRPSALLVYCAGTGETALASSGARKELLAYLAPRRIVSVFLEGFPDAFGSPRWNTTGDPDLTADQHYVHQVVQLMQERYPIDAGNVVLAGFSGGSSNAAVTAALRPDAFASLVIVGGSVSSTTPDDPDTADDESITFRVPEPQGNLPVLIVNGTQEPHRPFLGDDNHKGTYIAPNADYIAFWVSHMGLDPISHRVLEQDVTISEDGGDVTKPGRVFVKRYVAEPGDSRARLKTMIIEGMGHVWPSASGYNHIQGFDGDEVIARFMKKNRR